MSTFKTIENFVQKHIPTPFGIAVILTFLVMIWSIISMEGSIHSNAYKVLSFWEDGIWNNSLLVFAYQMMLILVLGHILVLSKPLQALLNLLTSSIDTTAKAVVIVSLSTMLMAFFNWGLGLIFGAILARKIGEAAQKHDFKINYPLIGASGYIGLMVWHGGMSGSAPLKVAEKGHLASLLEESVPEYISTQATIFSTSNLLTFGVLLLAMPLLLYILSRNKEKESICTVDKNVPYEESYKENGQKFENLKWPALVFGSIICISFFIQYSESLKLLRLTPNMLNFLMLGLCFIFHGSFINFLNALKESVSDVSGILIQFPLYFGIMGIMKDSGLALNIAESFVNISTTQTLPIFTFMSAGLLNIFVPSGGGQWAIQGPIILESSTQLGVPLPKMIMAMAYGDQITNMLQPFWALPLLAITKLKAHQLLPYTFWMFLVGSLIFILSLIFIY